MRPISQTIEAIGLISSQPRMKRLPTHLPFTSHLSDRATIGDHRQDSPMPLLGHTHLPHIREPQDQPKSLSSIS